MKLIDCSASLIREPNPFKKIEKAGRTCYKSEANITNESAIRFFNSLAENKHFAMMEHATFVFRVPKEITIPIVTDSKYINITKHKDTYWVSGNLRAICEDNSELGTLMQYTINDAIPGIAYNLYKDNTTPEKYTGPLLEIMNNDDVLERGDKELIYNHLYTTMRFICDRGVTHELVRHRPASFAQESTRYVNYATKGAMDQRKWSEYEQALAEYEAALNDPTIEVGPKPERPTTELTFIKPANFDIESESKRNHYIETFKYAENAYIKAINDGDKPQQARALLPNAIKTEIIVTATHKEWEHIFNLRYYGTTGKPHPDMKHLMEKAYLLYTEQFIF